MKLRISALVLLMSFFIKSEAQEIPIEQLKFVYFPHPLIRKSTTSIGVNATTMPYEITEELHYRLPALDMHHVQRLNKHFSLDARGNIQVVQNLFTLGPHWAMKLTDRVSVGAGYDFGYWFGNLNIEGFKTKGHGWQNFPNASLGYRFNKGILLTFRAETILTLDVKATADQTPIVYNFKNFSGSSYTVALEQPFFGNKTLTLGFRAIYSKFFWQTWTAFSNLDRDFFYPQLIVGVVL
jgi:hypothetical protein